MQQNKNKMSIIRALLSHSDASGSRSTILKPLTWLLGILLAVLLAAFRLGAPAWFCYLLAGIILVAVLLFFFAYGFCLFKDRDALRSESFSLRDKAVDAYKGKNNLVLEVSGGGTWFGYGPTSPDRDMFKWIKENWE